MNYREIDQKIASFFGWHYGTYHPELPHFSTTGEGMLLLIQKARKQDLDVWFKHTELGGFVGVCGIVSDGRGYEREFNSPVLSDPPLAMALAFLLAKGIDITPYVKKSS